MNLNQVKKLTQVLRQYQAEQDRLHQVFITSESSVNSQIVYKLANKINKLATFLASKLTEQGVQKKIRERILKIAGQIKNIPTNSVKELLDLNENTQYLSELALIQLLETAKEHNLSGQKLEIAELLNRREKMIEQLSFERQTARITQNSNQLANTAIECLNLDLEIIGKMRKMLKI